MRKSRPTLRERIEQDARQRDGRKQQRQTVKHRRRDEKDCRRNDCEGPHEAYGKSAGGQRTPARSRITSIKFTVNDAIEGHRAGTRADHRQRNPDDLR
jgi:hypothetical protein